MTKRKKDPSTVLWAAVGVTTVVDNAGDALVKVDIPFDHTQMAPIMTEHIMGLARELALAPEAYFLARVLVYSNEGDHTAEAYREIFLREIKHAQLMQLPAEPVSSTFTTTSKEA